MAPELSVVIPVFNGLPYLRAAVDSILGQTYGDFALWLVDDGSTDGSVEYCESLKDPRVIWRRREHSGYSRLMNAVVPEMVTPLVAVLHQDDVAVPTRLAEQVAFLSVHPEFDAVFCELAKMGEDGRSMGHYSVGSGREYDGYDPERYGSLVHTGLCFRKAAFARLGGYRPEFYPAADYDLLLRWWETGRVAVINKPLVHYRFHVRANTQKVFRRMHQMGRFVRKLSDLRRVGRNEMSFEEYVREFESGWWVRWRHYRAETGRSLYRRAGACVGGGRYGAGAAYLLLSLLWIPVTVIRTALWNVTGRRGGGGAANR